MEPQRTSRAFETTWLRLAGALAPVLAGALAAVLAAACSAAGSGSAGSGATTTDSTAPNPPASSPAAPVRSEPATKIEGPLHEMLFSRDEKAAHVVAGDEFSVILQSVMFDCVPRAAIDDAAAVSVVANSMLTPSFPTPLRNFVTRFHAKAAGKVKLAFSCSEDGRGNKKGDPVAMVPVTILAPEQAAPFVEIGSSAGLPEAALGPLRERAAACFDAELKKEPRSRGAFWVEFSVSADGTKMVVQIASATGLSEGLASCARTAVLSAAPITPPPGDHGTIGHCSLRFTMRPKTAAKP